MAEIVSPPNTGNPSQDPRLVFGAAESLAPNRGWGYAPSLQTSDAQVYRNKDRAAADARDAARANPYGRSALRVNVDAVVGKKLTLFLDPIADVLGVSQDEAESWAERVELMWNAAAESPRAHFDAQRKQTFTGLMRTAYQDFYSGGECLGVFKWKPSSNGQRTCLLQIQSERLSDPEGRQDRTGKIRMGVERDEDGAPTAYHIRERHQSDEFLFGPSGLTKWNRVPRYNKWGRWNIVHFFEHDRCDMTRGLSSFTTALLPMRLLNDYLLTELETAALRATYAAVIESELDYEKAMEVIGEDRRAALQQNPVLDFTLRMMADKASFYRGQDVKFGKSKVAHLLPNEKLHMVQGNLGQSVLKDYTDTNTNILASALGVAKESLTKDYSQTNYSGARAAIYDVWRSYEVQREGFITLYAWPVFVNWLEEMVALRGIIPMLGPHNFYDVVDALAYGTFETWTKPRLDPVKETEADLMVYSKGGSTLRELMRTEGGRDVQRTLRQRAKEKADMERLGLKPEDLDWSLRGEALKAEAMKQKQYPSDASNKQ
jgi:lambda family phage portal protein